MSEVSEPTPTEPVVDPTTGEPVEPGEGEGEGERYDGGEIPASEGGESSEPGEGE